MWGRRHKRGTRLSRLLALGRLEDAMAGGEPETASYPRPSNPAPAVPAARPSNPAPAVPAARTGLQAQDVPVDNSAGPAGAPQHHQDLPVQRNRDSTRHGSFG